MARVAYQTASSIRDPRTGEWHNYRYKKNELGQTHLLLPKTVTANISEHQQFWANLEAHYKRGNSVPARTASLALPVELSADENHELMLRYSHWLSDMYGVAVQATSHKPYSSNPHFHLAVTACTILPDGSFGKKAIALDPISSQRELKQRIAPVEILRLQWADMVNAALEKSGISERVDHRSYLRRGIQEVPQKHEGVWRHSSQDRVLGCPKEYNKNIETVNEVLHHDRRKFQKTAITRNNFGETATRGVGSNQKGTDRNQARHAPDAHNLDNLLNEAKMLMGTMDEITSGTVGEINLPSLEKPNLKTVVDAIMKVSNQLTSMNLRMTQLETLIASEAKDSPTS